MERGPLDSSIELPNFIPVSLFRIPVRAAGGVYQVYGKEDCWKLVFRFSEDDRWMGRLWRTPVKYTRPIGIRGCIQRAFRLENPHSPAMGLPGTYLLHGE